MTLALAIRSALVLALGLVAVAGMRRRSAAARHAVLAAALAATILIALSRFLPRWKVNVPESAATRVMATRVTQPLNDVLNERAAPSPQLPVGELAFRLWSAGFLAMASLTLLSHISAHRLLRRATRRGHVFASAELATPVTIGVFVSAIVVPEEFDEWPRADREAALLHEAAHVARRDTLMQLVADIARCLYWFDPLVWIARRRLKLECERACDDRVIAGGHDATGYASLLLRLAQTMSASTPAALAMIRPSELERRIVAVLDDHAPRRTLGMIARASLAVAALAVAIPVAAIIPAGALDHYLDPLTERVPGVRNTIPNVVATGDEGPIIAELLEGAAKPSTWRGDLVSDRSRWALQQVENGRIVEPLIRHLADDDWRVRGYAAWALAVAGDRRATPALVPLLEHPVWRLRGSAAFALHHIGDPRAERAMDAALHDEAWQVRVEAAAYFAKLGDRDRLVPMQADPHVAVRIVVADALKQ